ncbi:MAG: hypothetical protein I3274_08225, partial [Candidatus Moeniiplasma glomeromycotorum]|nr:hypothetical protein [Candidatus Moeniiplasma glomeromycotorum]
MKKIHEILNISSEKYWDSISKERKIDLIIDFLLHPQDDICKIMYIENSIRAIWHCRSNFETEKFNSLCILTKAHELKKKLASPNYSHASKFITFNNYVKSRKSYVDEFIEKFPAECERESCLIKTLDEIKLLCKEFAKLGERSKGLKIPNVESENFNQLENETFQSELENIEKVLRTTLTLELRKIKQRVYAHNYLFRDEFA